MDGDISLKERLLRYMQNRHAEWIAKGDLERLVLEHTKHTSEYCNRELRKLAEAGDLEVSYRGSKHHAFYRAKPKVDWREQQKAGEELWNSLPDKKQT